jgi:hypothetical protein
MDEPECWSVNWTIVESKPTTDLCKAWTAWIVTAKGWKYEWKCRKSWLEVQCAAIKKDKASCGRANWKKYEKKPTKNLCWVWEASAVTEEWTTKYTWECIKGTDKVLCEALRAQPECWSANWTIVKSKPKKNLCKYWTAWTVTENDGKYEWKCKRSGLEVKCSASKKTEELPYVEIEKKELLWEKFYDVWDKVSFRIDFKNNTSKEVSNVLIRDFFPLNLKLLETSISVKWAKKREYYAKNEDGINENLVIEFSWFSLKSWKSWYIILTWEVTDDFMTYTQNCAFSYKKDW